MVSAAARDNGQVAAERTGWRAASPRRLIAFLSQAEERPAVPAAGRAADAALAVAATVAAVVAVILQLRTTSGPVGIFVARPGFPVVELGHPHGTWPTPVTLLGVVLTTAPLAFRRIYPITAFCVILAAVIGTTRLRDSDHVRGGDLRRVLRGRLQRVPPAALLSVLAAAVVVTAAYPNTTPPVPERFTALLVLLPTVAVGVAIRVWRRRAGESAERLRQAQAEHEAQTRPRGRAGAGPDRQRAARRGDAQRQRDGGAGRRGPAGAGQLAGRRHGTALLAVEASGRAAMTELRHLLGLLAPAGDARRGFRLQPAGGEAVLSPQPGLGQLRPLIDRVRAAGLPVELSVGGRAAGLPPGLDLAAYRVVQEALTNVIKHAGQARTTVTHRLPAAANCSSTCPTTAARPIPRPPRPARASRRARAAVAGCSGCANGSQCTAARSTPGPGPAAAGGWRSESRSSRRPTAPAAGPARAAAIPGGVFVSTPAEEADPAQAPRVVIADDQPWYAAGSG